MGTMSGWQRLYHLIELEIQQRLEEGCELDGEAWLAKRDAIRPDDSVALFRLMHELQNNEPPTDCTFLEPYDLKAIRNQRPDHENVLPFAAGEKDLFNRLHGGWMGRCCACMAGRPFECEPFTGQHAPKPHDAVIRWLQHADAWPLQSYVPETSRAEMRGLHITNINSTREHIKAMEADDALDFLLVGLEMIDEFGSEFETHHVGRAWSKFLAYDQLPPAETQSFINLLHDDSFSREIWGDKQIQRVNWQKVATINNPYREWRHGRLRTDIHGLLWPGDPEHAAENAWRDARISHTKSGLFSSMFFAAMIAAAFTTPDPMALIEAGLGQIPADCRLAHSILEALNLRGQYVECVPCWEELLAEFEGSHPHHAIPNSVICVLAILYGEGDFEKSIGHAVSLGRNPAANAATVGTIMGVLHGARSLPVRWTQPLSNTLRSNIKGYIRGTISDGARRCMEIINKRMY